MSGSDKITVLNPTGFPPKVVTKPLAPRLSALDGKTVYLVDCRFDDSIELLKQVQAWFAEHMPSVKTAIISLSATYQHDECSLDSGLIRRVPVVAIEVAW